MIDITIGKGFEESFNLLKLIGNGQELKKVNVRAMNRALTTSVSSISKEVRKKYTVKDKEVKRTLSIKKANFSNSSGKILSKGYPLPLKSFSISVGRKSFSVKIKKNSSRKKLKRTFLTNSTKKSWTGVVKRTNGKNRYPIKPVYSLSIPQMIANDDIRKIIENEATAMFNKRFNHEIDNLLKRYVNKR